MTTTKKIKASKNGSTADEIVATVADFTALIDANPQLQLPLINIIQKRLLAEKDAEIKRLSKALK